MYGSGSHRCQVDFSAPARLALALLIAAASAPAAAAQAWTSVGPPLSIQALAVGAAQPAPALPGVIYASVTGLDGILSSADEGASWRSTGPIFLGPRVGCCGPPGPALDFQLFADPVTPGTAYALADRFLHKTVDGGLTWQPIFGNQYPLTLNNLAFAPSGKIYGVNDFGYVGTTDGFATTSQEVDSPAGPFAGLAVDPADPTRIYVSSTSSHLIYSNAGAGATLTPLPALPDSLASVIQLAVDGSTTPSTLLVLASGGEGTSLYFAQPGGASGGTPFWTAPASVPGGATAIAIDRHVPGAVYLASNSGFFVSHDHGNTWTPQQAGLRSNHVMDLALDPTLLGPVWVGTDSGLAMLGRGGCRAGSETACLEGARFQTQVSYRLGGQTATATAAQLTDETTAFWFTGPASYELLVKVLDGTFVNGEFWVFSGGLSDIEYTVTVTDVLTGTVKNYPKAAGILKSFADTGAFHGKAAAERVAAPSAARSPVVPSAAPPGACTADATDLCLAGSRFQAKVSWLGGSLSGSGEAVALTDDTGSFWFLAPDNYELTVKILDGTVVNGHFWVFYGAMTDFAFTLTVTDTTNGKVKTYTNRAGTIPSAADTSTF
jgi:hypothetical protein